MNGLPDAAADALVEARVVVAGEAGIEDEVAADDDSVVLAGGELVTDVVAADVLATDVLGADELDLDDPPPQPASARAATHRTAVPRGTEAIVTS